jgi:hypothetical protein
MFVERIQRFATAAPVLLLFETPAYALGDPRFIYWAGGAVVAQLAIAVFVLVLGKAGWRFRVLSLVAYAGVVYAIWLWAWRTSASNTLWVAALFGAPLIAGAVLIWIAKKTRGRPVGS